MSTTSHHNILVHVDLVELLSICSGVLFMDFAFVKELI